MWISYRIHILPNFKSAGMPPSKISINFTISKSVEYNFLASKIQETHEVRIFETLPEVEFL